MGSPGRGPDSSGGCGHRVAQGALSRRSSSGGAPTPPAALAAAAQRRLRGSWAPGSDWHGHPTYITDCPDFSGPLTDCFDACGKTSKGIADMPPILLGAIRQVGGMLQQAPMNHDLLDDPELLARLDTANRGIIAKAFDNVTLD